MRPTVAEVEAYCRERHNHVDPQKFVDYYIANGWRVGRNPMKDWKAAVRTWERNGHDNRNGKPKDILQIQFTEAASEFIARGEV